jgi:addiction module RelE/StbE family toxin
MQLRWTEEAAADLDRISDYLFEQTPVHVGRIVLEIYEAPELLTSFPLRGRIGRKPGTRELVLSSLPYILIYTVSDQVIHITRILHGAQQWP